MNHPEELPVRMTHKRYQELLKAEHELITFKESAQSARVAALKEIIAIALPWVERCPSDGLVAQKQAILAKMQAVFTEAAPLTEESEEELAEKIAYAWYPAAKDNPDGIAGEQFQKLRQFALEALRGRIKGKG